MAAASIADAFLSFPKTTCELATRPAVVVCSLERRAPKLARNE
jgi:hypothetical protein